MYTSVRYWISVSRLSNILSIERSIYYLALHFHLKGILRKKHWLSAYHPGLIALHLKSEDISGTKFSFNRVTTKLLVRKLSSFKQLLDEVFVMSGIIKVEVSDISRSRRLRLITLTETLIIPDIRKTESNNCFIILYLQVISQFLAGSMKRIEKPFLLRCPRTWHCCPCTWH